MSMLQGARYGLALWMAALLPPAIVFWIVVHPFIAFWRRVGVRGTYWILIPPMLASAGLLFSFHRPIMAVDFGFTWGLAVPGLILFGISVELDRRAKEHLKFRILAGVPELQGPEHSTLLKEGLYRRVRHPRYVAIMLSVAGVALLTNYLVSYLLVGVTIVGLWIVAMLEEKELVQRFGDEYRAYAEVVPRFLPRRVAGSQGGSR